VSANHALETWIPPEHLPLEARPWHVLWPSTDLERLTSAAQEAIRTAEAQSVVGWAVSGVAPRGSQAVWEVDLRPVTDIGGAVTHLLVLVTDVTAETAISRRLNPLVALTSMFRQKQAPLDLLRAGVLSAQELVPNDGSLLALAPRPGQDALNVIAASGVWSAADRGIGNDLHLTLVLNVVRTAAPLELGWNTSTNTAETIRILPLIGGRALAEGYEALGALAFARRGLPPFPAEDCQLIDELAGRLSLALDRTDLRGTAV
jgi:hypothetical protein